MPLTTVSLVIAAIRVLLLLGLLAGLLLRFDLRGTSASSADIVGRHSTDLFLAVTVLGDGLAVGSSGSAGLGARGRGSAILYEQTMSEDTAQMRQKVQKGAYLVLALVLSLALGTPLLRREKVRSGEARGFFGSTFFGLT